MIHTNFGFEIWRKSQNDTKLSQFGITSLSLDLPLIKGKSKLLATKTAVTAKKERNV